MIITKLGKSFLLHRKMITFHDLFRTVSKIEPFVGCCELEKWAPISFRRMRLIYEMFRHVDGATHQASNQMNKSHLSNRQKWSSSTALNRILKQNKKQWACAFATPSICLLLTLLIASPSIDRTTIVRREKASIEWNVCISQARHHDNLLWFVAGKRVHRHRLKWTPSNSKSNPIETLKIYLFCVHSCCAWIIDWATRGDVNMTMDATSPLIDSFWWGERYWDANSGVDANGTWQFQWWQFIAAFVSWAPFKFTQPLRDNNNDRTKNRTILYSWMALIQ